MVGKAAGGVMPDADSIKAGGCSSLFALAVRFDQVDTRSR